MTWYIKIGTLAPLRVPVADGPLPMFAVLLSPSKPVAVWPAPVDVFA